MKKIIPIIVLFLFGVVNLSALEPIRISIVTSPFEGHDVYIDILNTDGSSTAIPVIKKSELSTDASGVLSFIMDEEVWTDLTFSIVKNYIVKISIQGPTGGTIVIGLQRLEDLIAAQGLFGSLVDPNEINQDGDYIFHSLQITDPQGIETLAMVLKDDGDLLGTNGNYLNKITFDAPANVTEDYSLIFPSAEPEENLSVLRWDNGSLEWALPLYGVNPDAGLAIVPIQQQPADLLDDGTINLMADIDGTTLKFDHYHQVSLGGTNYVYVPDPDAKIIVNQNNPFNWTALHVFASGLRDSTQNGGPHWAIGYQHDLNSWFNGVQSFIYEEGDGGSSLRESFYSGAVTSGNDDASVIVHHDTYGEGTTTEEIGMTLSHIPTGYTGSEMANPVFYINKSGTMNFGIDILGNIQMNGTITNDGVTAPNAITIDDEMVVKGSLKINTNSDGDPLSFPTSDGNNGQILTTDGSGNLGWTDYPTITLQSAYDGGRTIDAADGPVRITSSDVNGGLDVYTSGSAGDAIDARLTGTFGETQTAVQGIYRVEVPDGEGSLTMSHFGYLGGSFSMGEGPSIMAGVAGLTSDLVMGGPLGALGVTMPSYNEGSGGQFAAMFVGDVFMIMGSFVEDTYFDQNVFIHETLDVTGYTHLRDNAYFYKYATFNAAIITESFSMPLTRGSNNDVLTSNGDGTTSWSPTTRSVWGLGGNAPLDGTSFLGTTNGHDLVFKVNGQPSGLINFDKGNTSFGYQAFISNSTGSQNVAIGQAALIGNTIGTNNVSVGAYSLRANETGNENIAIGINSLNNNVIGNSNTAVGTNALFNNTSSNNTAFGSSALFANTTGTNNVAVGFNALTSNTDGGINTAIGTDAGRYVGDGTSPNTSGSGSVFVGNNTRASAADNTSEIVIGTNAVGHGNYSVTLGSNAITRLYSDGAYAATSASAPNMYVAPDGQIMRSTATPPTVTLQSAYEGGRDIDATAGPVRILNASNVNGGLDVYASGSAGDAIDARLTGTFGETQTAIQGVYSVEIPSGESESFTLTQYGFLGGSFSFGEGMPIIAGVAGTIGNDYTAEGFSAGALGVSVPELGQFSAFLLGDVFLEGSFVNDAFFDQGVTTETLNVNGYLELNHSNATNSYKLPTTRGTSGQVLTTDGAGATSWTTPSTGGGSGLNAFGYCFELATIVDEVVVGGNDVPFSNNGSLTNIIHFAGAPQMTALVAGTYKIEYNISYTSGVGAQIAIAVNGTVNSSTPVSLLNPTGTITGTAILNLAAGDVITLRNNSATPLVMTLAPATGSQITITKLD